LRFTSYVSFFRFHTSRRQLLAGLIVATLHRERGFFI
jgi:hypothetical protein